MKRLVVLFFFIPTLSGGCTFFGSDGHKAEVPVDPRLEEGDPDANRDQWAENRPASYRFTFQWQCFCAPDYRAPVRLTVTDTTITDGVYVESGEALTEEERQRYLTVDGLFALIQDAVDRDAATINAKYHETLGFPGKVWIDYDTGIADEERGFQVDEFVILNP